MNPFVGKFPNTSDDTIIAIGRLMQLVGVLMLIAAGCLWVF